METSVNTTNTNSPSQNYTFSELHSPSQNYTSELIIANYKHVIIIVIIIPILLMRNA